MSRWCNVSVGWVLLVSVGWKLGSSVWVGVFSDSMFFVIRCRVVVVMIGLLIEVRWNCVLCDIGCCCL